MTLQPAALQSMNHPRAPPVAYDEAPTHRFHLLVSIAAAGGQFSDGYILGTIGIALSLATDALHLNALWLGLLGGASLAGLFAGSLLLAPLADRLGRRPLLVATMAVFAAVSLLQFFVTAAWELLVLRLVLGLALGIDYVVCCTVVAEFAPRRTRGQLLALLILMWSVGYTAAFVFGTLLASSGVSESWRWILFSSAVPSAVVLLLRWKIPESPPWLLQVGRIEAARAIIARYMGENVQLPNIRAVAPGSLAASWRELFGARYRVRTAVGAIFYTAQVIPYFALGTFIPTVFGALGIESTYVSGVVFNVFMLLGSGFGLWVVDRITRRQFLVGGFYVSAALLLFLAAARVGPALTVSASALFAFVLAASTVLDFVYLPELFPTRLRAAGVGVGTAASRVGSAFSTFMLPLCMQSLGIRPTLGLCVAVLVAGGVMCQAFAPETRGRSIDVD
jgi:putative MFS transporter